MAKKSLPAFMTKGKAAASMTKAGTSVGKEVVAKAKKGKGKPKAVAAKGKNPFAKY